MNGWILDVGYNLQTFLAKFCVNEFTYFGTTVLRITYPVCTYIYIYIYIYIERERERERGRME